LNSLAPATFALRASRLCRWRPRHSAVSDANSVLAITPRGKYQAPKARHIPRKPGALPQACNEIAPLALTRDRRHWFGVEKEKAPGGVTPLGADSPGANCLRCYFTANLNSM